MKYLITGGAGFIGSHLAEELLKNDNQVIVFDNLSTGRYQNVQSLEKNPNFQFVEGDILDITLMDKLVEKVDVIFHLAAAVGVKLIIKDPLGSMITNIKGSEIVLEIAHRYRKKVLLTSSSEIYGKNSNGPLREDDDRILGSPLKSRWSYSTSKALDEILAYIYWREKGVPTIIVRLFNTVGPKQTDAYGMVIPSFVSQALENKPLTIYGDGKQSRCFIHVEDVVKGIVKLADNPKAVGQAFNIGSQEEITIEDLAKMVIELTGSKSQLMYIPYDQAYEEGFEDMPRRVPDIAKAHNMVGFKPSMRLTEIINDVIKFYRKK